MDKPAKALWEPLNTFAWGYQQPLLWSWVCCKTGSNLSVQQVPQHNVSLSAKVLLKIIFGQYVDSVTLERMRWNVFLYVFVRLETARLYWPESVFFFVFLSLLPFFLIFEIVEFFNNCVCMCTCVYACEIYHNNMESSLVSQFVSVWFCTWMCFLLNGPFMVDANLLFLCK